MRVSGICGYQEYVGIERITSCMHYGSRKGNGPHRTCRVVAHRFYANKESAHFHFTGTLSFPASPRRRHSSLFPDEGFRNYRHAWTPEAHWLSLQRFYRFSPLFTKDCPSYTFFISYYIVRNLSHNDKYTLCYIESLGLE